MSDGFLVKLGESKAEKSEKGFTKIHNDTFFELAKVLEPGPCLLYLAISTYAYGNNVVTFPKLETLAERLGVSRDTVKRWKAKLVEKKVIRAIPCYGLDGMRSVDVMVINSSYPEVPEEWDTFAPHGFVIVSGKPVLHEEWEKTLEIAKNTVTKVGADLHLPENQRGQICTDSKINITLPVMIVEPNNDSRGKSAPTEIPEGANMPLPADPEIAVTVAVQSTFLDEEEENLLKINKTNLVVEGLTQYFEDQTGQAITHQKMQSLIDAYGAERVQQGIKIIMSLYEWPIGPEGALAAALRDNWNTPASKENINRQKRETKQAKSAKKETEKDPRYDAFYKLFPDS